MKTFGINGFGRIGRIGFRAWWKKYRKDLDLKLINTSGSMDLNGWIHLLKYDTSYGPFSPKISYQIHQSNKDVTDEDPVLGNLIIEGKKILVTAQRDPSKIPWGDNNIEIVLESTGVFRTEESASMHLKGGAKQVMISAPAKGGNVDTSVIGVNKFDKKSCIFSNASCTTNCIAPIVKVILDNFGIKKGIMTTIHAFTDGQNTQDNSHKKDLRRARTASQNMIPTTTGAAKATTELLPELKNLFNGMAVRVPIATGSLADMVLITEKKTTIKEINDVLIKASKSNEFTECIATTDEPIVSSDIIGRDEQSIVDLSLTNVIDGDMVKIVSWYDNEWGYCCSLLKQMTKI